MPKVRRANVPASVLRHLHRRAVERGISMAAVRAFAAWLDKDPMVPEGKWFKTFDGFQVCGEGELVLRVLRVGQAPEGERLA